MHDDTVTKFVECIDVGKKEKLKNRKMVIIKQRYNVGGGGSGSGGDDNIKAILSYQAISLKYATYWYDKWAFKKLSTSELAILHLVVFIICTS